MNRAPGRPAGATARTRMGRFVWYWLPAAAYVALIFIVSSIRGGDLPSAFPNLDKLAHLLEYSLLGLLLGRAIRFTLGGRGRAAAVGLTIAAGAFIGAMDEIYQRRIPGRSSDVRDWVVDVAAVALSVLLVQWVSARSLRGRLRAAGGAAAAAEPNEKGNR
ncbi:MAG TPA: VanZ family protein [Candidatus Eisenbacteria bacterium]|nr:VanZ family protein [Candidatus Eisenbacteria bacterium]